MDLEKIKKNFLEKINSTKNFEQLKELKANFLGKKSELNELLKNIANLTSDKKKEIGSKINELRGFIVSKLEEIEKVIKDKLIKEELEKESLDISLPVRQSNIGFIHPISKVQQEFREILYSMGFTITNGSEIENDWNCFEGLNIPKHHPARQMQDTFYLNNNEDNDKSILLRTQTSSMEIREMTGKKPPFKFFCTGKVFRSEMDATHAPMFHQMEGVYLDKNITMQDLKNCLITILKKYFDINKVPLRFRPSYFPFTSPSVEVDIKYKKESDRILLGEGDNWIEILGAGMLYPNVLKNVGIDNNEYQGFAFGFGIERMAMLKYGIKDIRNLYDGDIRFLKHYGFRIFE